MPWLALSEPTIHGRPEHSAESPIPAVRDTQAALRLAPHRTTTYFFVRFYLCWTYPWRWHCSVHRLVHGHVWQQQDFGDHIHQLGQHRCEV